MSIHRAVLGLIAATTLLPTSARAQASRAREKSAPVRRVISIGNHPRVDGLRINFRDRELDLVRGANVTVWSPYQDAGGTVKGLALGLPMTGAGRIDGIGLGLLGVSANEDLRGLMIGGIGAGAGGDMRGITIGGIGAGAGGSVRGFAFGGVSVGAGGDTRGLAIGSLVRAERVRGLVVSPLMFRSLRDAEVRGVTASEGQHRLRQPARARDRSGELRRVPEWRAVGRDQHRAGQSAGAPGVADRELVAANDGGAPYVLPVYLTRSGRRCASSTADAEVHMPQFSRSVMALVAAALLAPALVLAQGAAVPAQEWQVPWGAADRPRDPYVAPDGSVFFVGQEGNYVARLDPRSGEFKRYVIDPGTNPHNLIVDAQGMVWYAGNRNGMIGKLDPRTGAITRYPMPDTKVRDPHTLVFDARGDIWFTAQNSGAVGHLETRTGKIRLAFTGANTRPYGIVLNSKGVPWFNLFGTDKIATIDPASMAVRTYTLPNEGARGRRIAVTSDDVIWYGDYTRGFLGRLDPRTGAIEEIPMPAGRASLPYGMASDDKDRIWLTENVPNKGTRLVAYDPKTKTWVANAPVGQPTANTVRHMYFDKKTGLLWFGSDQGTIGRADVSRVRTAM